MDGVLHSPTPDAFPWSEFQLRCNRNRVSLDKLMDWLTLAALSISLTRHWFEFSIWERTHILAHMALVVAGAAWRLTHLCSYERWRHCLAPALRVSLISGPGAWKITTLALQAPAPWGAAESTARQLAGATAVLLFASAVATNCTMGLARSVNLPANAATQAVVVGILLYVRRIVCATPVFQGPEARGMLGACWRLFAWVRLALPTPQLGPTPAVPQDCTTLCYGVLGAVQLWAGFLAPVALSAFAEARWLVSFEKEVRQRRQQQARRRGLVGGQHAGATNGRLPVAAWATGPGSEGVRGGTGWLGEVYRWLAGGSRQVHGVPVGQLSALLLVGACWEIVTGLLL